MTMVEQKKIRSILLRWYKKNQRASLPWRHTRDPYKILVSEIMLQQTQVSRVIEKYHEFLTAFPTVQDLASAKASAVIAAWKGLGYNRRALFLQKTAQAIVNEHGGVFPQTIEALVALPGVGDYTARAVLSFSFEQPVPMMDTNHRRFYQRILFGIDTKKDKELLVAAEALLPKKRAYDWNQALMDFGSLVCTTSKPKCEICPLQSVCQAYPEILTAEPRKKKKKKAIPFKQTDRYFRGRIIDHLREHNTLSERKAAGLFAEISKERLLAIISGLEKDGLIIRRKKSMLLPE